ncbi:MULTISPECIES: GNAT family N-acetyltransferase [Photobacterium]|uniref:GNAT family N-acetyltransferase n=1 Tax=Photobacterium TaxID=657 RepID=UPI001C2CEA4B|nr:MULTISPECIES: GNAT family N-acetyltransferase [Photobacterium]MBV1841747.1 GNAT family N-acetyltransferase [Photobacterium ganghwense]
MKSTETLHIKTVDVDAHYPQCLAFRREAYQCSFGHTDGFDDAFEDYEARIRSRLELPEWRYEHVWLGDEIIGQLEYKAYSFEPGLGYVHLIYLAPEYRGAGIADKLQHYLAKQFLSLGCQGAILSVSKTNVRALRHYQKNGWHFLKPNCQKPPKQTDYYQVRFQSLHQC